MFNRGILHMTDKAIDPAKWADRIGEKEWRPIKMGVMYPGTTISFNAPDNQILPAEFEQKIKRGEVLLYFIGRIEYMDVFNNPHTTKFCGRYYPVTNRVDICDTYNDAN
jgi:hypothetical protein